MNPTTADFHVTLKSKAKSQPKCVNSDVVNLNPKHKSTVAAILHQSRTVVIIPVV